MKTLIIPRSLRPELLPMADYMERGGRGALRAGEGDAVLPLRTMVRMPDKSGLLG